METTCLGSDERFDIYSNEDNFSLTCFKAIMKSKHALSPVYRTMILNNANDLFIQGVISLEFLRELRNEI